LAVKTFNQGKYFLKMLSFEAKEVEIDELPSLLDLYRGPIKHHL
jgi:hypothetical protein